MGIRETLRRLRQKRSSIADNRDYPEFCDLASRRDDVFASFKSNRTYTKILEHTTREQGAAYLERIVADAPHLADFRNRFRENDRIGRTQTYDYGSWGAFSPSTLRYIKVLGDLERHFGDLAPLRVAEIGGGYGGQCLTTSSYRGFASYTLIDLKECLRLAARYLKAHAVPDVAFRSMDELQAHDEYDLVISNYAFTECQRDIQETYFERVLAASPRGYLTCNVIAPKGFDSFTREQLLERLPGSVVLPEVPLTHESNFVLVWGHTPTAAAE